MESQLRQLSSWGVSNLSTVGYTVTGIGPVSIKAERRISPWFGIGPVLSISRASIKYRISPTPAGSPGLNIMTTNHELNRYEVLSLGFGAKSYLYLSHGKHTDVFASVTAGYLHTTIKYSGDYAGTTPIQLPRIVNPYIRKGPDFLTDPYHPFLWGISIGIREHISNHFGVLVEFGCERWTFLHLGLFFRSY